MGAGTVGFVQAGSAGEQGEFEGHCRYPSEAVKRAVAYPSPKLRKGLS